MEALKPQEIIPALGLLGLGFVVLPAALIAVVTDTRPRTARCPETGQNALVRLDPVRAVKTMFTGAAPRIGMCSRWPERASCGQTCLSQF